jgi:hypothetical protein
MNLSENKEMLSQIAVVKDVALLDLATPYT